MSIPREDDFITNSDESRRLPDENPEPLEGTKTEESTLLKAEHKPEDTKDTPKPEDQPKKELK